MELGRLVGDSLRNYFTEHDVTGYYIAYSGGLDSSLLAYLGNHSLHGITVGSENSKDFRNMEKGTKVLGISPELIHIEDLDLGKYISFLREIDPVITRRDIGYELVLAIVLDHTQGDHLITGQGADELFYGYHRLAERPEDTNEWHINKLIRETLPREKAMADYFGKKLVTPYLDSGVGQILANVSRDEHFSGDTNKAILRSAALYLGMPESLVEVRKTAAQYGSGVMKLLKSSPLWKDLPEANPE